MSIKKLLAALYLVSTFILTICPPGVEEAHATDSFDTHSHELLEVGHSVSEENVHLDEKKVSLSYTEKNECEGELDVLAADVLVTTSSAFLDMQCAALPVMHFQNALLGTNTVSRIPEKIDKPPPIFAGIHTIVVRE